MLNLNAIGTVVVECVIIEGEVFLTPLIRHMPRAVVGSRAILCSVSYGFEL